MKRTNVHAVDMERENVWKTSRPLQMAEIRQYKLQNFSHFGNGAHRYERNQHAIVAQFKNNTSISHTRFVSFSIDAFG